jgi:hypothetical protein
LLSASLYRDDATLASFAGTWWFVISRLSAGRGPIRQIADRRVQAMPSLIRLLMVVGLLGGAAYGAMFALANFVQPKQREMTITIPQQRLKPN